MAIKSTLLLAILAGRVFGDAAPEPMITDAPVMQLEERDQTPLIGYEFVGNSYIAFTCNTGTFTTSGSWGICCPVASCYYGTKCDGGSIYYDRTNFVSNCNTGGGGLGICYTVTLYKSTGDESPLHMYNCESNWQATFKTDNINPSTYTSSSGSSVTTDTGSSSSSTNSASSGGTATSASVAVTSIPPVAAGVGATESKGSNAGLIAGATIGGIAAVALVGIAILLAVRFSKKKSAAANNTTDPNKMQSAPGTAPPGYVEPYKVQPNHYYGGPQQGQQMAQQPQEMMGTMPGQNGFSNGYGQELQGTPVGELPAVQSPTANPAHHGWVPK